MSEIYKDGAGVDFDSSDHQTSYVFTPAGCHDNQPLRPKKRRKISKQRETAEEASTCASQIQFPSLLNGLESSSCVNARHRLFKDSWGYTDTKIQSILRDANETTLGEVTAFVDGALSTEERDYIPAGLIVTGPNIASQELLFTQLAERLKSAHVNDPVVILRSSDASNLKTVLKKLIRVATNRKDDDGDELQTKVHDGRKLLDYDLQILHDHHKSSKSSKVVVAIQDSEAFDSSLLGEMVILFNSWLDRIPFILLFGIATSVELFQERLPKGAIRYLHGSPFDVEQTSETLEKVFQNAVASSNAPLLLGYGFISLLIGRQNDYIQSLQTFVSALKYAYMCHYYANPLSIFLMYSMDSEAVLEVQPEHFEAIRTLPSFRRRVETLINKHRIAEARALLDSDEALHNEVRRALSSRRDFIVHIQQTMHIILNLTSGLPTRIDRMDLYVKVFSGQLEDSNILKDIISSIKMMNPGEALTLTEMVLEEIESGDLENSLEGWTETVGELVEGLSRIQSEIQNLQNHVMAANTTLRSKYTMQTKVLRTTIVAQKVHLSKEQSSLSAADMSYSNLLDELAGMLEGYLKLENPLDQFLHEVWIYDSKSPYREVFTPKPRHATERALSAPRDYLGCTYCKASVEGLLSSQPPTAILYQLYLETGGLINVFDLWSAFYAIIGGENGADHDERSALVLFYRSLADLKLLGMVKQSRKKTDHLAKLAWKGL